jgi:hypothetical protein
MCTAATAKALTAGDAVLMEHNQAANYCQDFTYTQTSSLALLAVVGHSLCLSPNGTDDKHLILNHCATVAGGDTDFTISHNNTPHNAHPQTIIHKGSGMCVEGADQVGAQLLLATCDEKSAAQQWVFGASGRFCHKSYCISAGAM